MHFTEQGSNGGKERSLVIRTPAQVDIASPHARGLLREVRFSPQFIERLMGLNRAFLDMAPRVEEVFIQLIPGKTPRIDADIRYASGYVIELRSTAGAEAALTIRARDIERIRPNWGINLETLQAFVADIVPDREAHLRADPHIEERDNIPPLDIPIADVTAGMIDDWNTPRPNQIPDTGTEHVPYRRGSFKVHLQDQEDPLFQLTLWEYYPVITKNEVERIFLIEEMRLEGSTPKIEAAMDKVVQHLLPPSIS